MSDHAQRVLLVSGGVGGARLAHGFDRLGEGVALTVVVNTGDDFEHLGLHISPDIDTVLYTLAGIANRAQGWGIEGESWRVLDRLAGLGGEAWFRLGDLDIATHLYRTGCLRSGQSLSAVVETLRTRLGVRSTVLPASDDPLRTRLETDLGLLDFQHYFVREQCRPAVRAVHFEGAERARPAPALQALLAETSQPFDLVVLAPSNPFLSLAPVLAVPHMAELLRAAAGTVVAVSPIVAGRAIKGPAAKLMGELGLDPGAEAWARYLAGRYPELVDHWVLDQQDAEDAARLRAAGLRASTAATVMGTEPARSALARWLLEQEFGRA